MVARRLSDYADTFFRGRPPRLPLARAAAAFATVFALPISIRMDSLLLANLQKPDYISRMDEPENPSHEPMDGDWCLVDLSEEITEEATKVAHALGMDFYAFMRIALEEKLVGLRRDEALQSALTEVQWTPLLKQ